VTGARVWTTCPPKVDTQQWNGRESSSWPVESQAPCLNHYRHTTRTQCLCRTTYFRQCWL